jgi:hypothetical protein
MFSTMALVLSETIRGNGNVLDTVLLGILIHAGPDLLVAVP